MRLFVAVLTLAAACGAQRGGAGDDSDGNAGNDSGAGGVDGATQVSTYVYAHTQDTLYQIEPETLAITRLASFSFTTGADRITDIAINKAGVLLGISFTSVYSIDPVSGAATRLSTGLSGIFNGLSFVPAEQIGQVGDDVLVATRNADGAVFKIDPATGVANQIGNMGAFSSSGDVVSVAGFGTVLTAENGAAPDRLVRLAPQSFAATPIGTTTGFGEIWGIAFWKNRVFGFTNAGEFILIDPSTGTATLVQGGGPAWWGAAVTTDAPVLL